jgi:hypothetical protein
MNETEITPRVEGRTREGRAILDAQRAAKRAAEAEAQAAISSATNAEIETPGGKRITRENRRGFGAQSQKLAYPDRMGYHRHWFNDTPGRIAGALESGYTHVNGHDGKPVTRVVGVNTTGGPLLGFLLEIPEEWWEDDMAENEKINQAKEESIKRGAQPKDAKDQNAFYPTAQGRRLEIRR